MNSVNDSKKNFFYSSMGLLLIILTIKIIFTLFTLFVYAKFSPFPDSARYLNAHMDWNINFLFNRTLFTDFVYAALKQLLIFNTAVHLFISILLGWVLWYVIKDDYDFINKPLLAACLFLPHFLIWSGIVGKEALAIAGFLLFIKSCVDLAIRNKLKIIPLVIGFFLGVVERPHYALAYAYLFFISLVFIKSKIPLMSLFSPRKSKLIFLSVMAYLGVLCYQFRPILSGPLLKFMFEAQRYFYNFVNSGTNRWDIVWQHPKDFFTNLPWGIPISIIGPTSSEALARPVLFPVFLEGCIAFLLLIFLFYMLMQLIKKYPQYSTLIIWGFIPAVLIGLLMNYPFGIFNPGSAIRYKQTLAPLLYFYPLLLTAAIRKKLSLEHL